MRTLTALFVSLRPAQWVKNLVLPLPFLFGGALGEARGWVLAGAGFAGFLRRVERGLPGQRRHGPRARPGAPVKRRRPLATGELRVAAALAAAAVLLAAGLLAAFLLSRAFGLWCFLYAALMVAYSLWLKRVPFVEALIVAAGLPLRALAGAALAELSPSFFLMGCAYLLALFLVVGKTAVGAAERGRPSAEHRAVLAAYGAEGLDFLFVVTALTTVAALRRLQRASPRRSRSTAAARSRRRSRS